MSEFTNRVIDRMRHFGVEFESGLSPSELNAIEAALNREFCCDHRDLLFTAVPVGP